MTGPTYDEIGSTYARTRRPDPRIARLITDALGDARAIVNVGAGTGSYEPNDRAVVAVDPAMTMLLQRRPDAAPAVCARAEALPFPDDAFDAAMAILTIHHWSDPWTGIAELRRVAPRVVMLTADLEVWRRFWLIEEYVPAIATLDEQRLQPIDRVAAALGDAVVIPIPVPHDCVDGFNGAYWRRPHAFLDPSIRAGMSTFASLASSDVEPGIERLRRDLQSGRWMQRYGDLLERETLDLGYRLLVAHR